MPALSNLTWKDRLVYWSPLSLTPSLILQICLPKLLIQENSFRPILFFCSHDNLQIVCISQTISHAKGGVDLAGIFDPNDSAQQAEQALKIAGNTIAKTAKNAVKNGVKRQGKKLLKKAGKAAAKLAVKAIKAFIQAIIKLIATIGPWGALILLVIVIFAAAFNFMKDERGSSSQMTLDPAYENPTTMTDEGYIKATAMTESQALIDAYYKYLSCDSFQKVYVDESGAIHRYNFSNVAQTADFAGLADLYSRENYFYLSSYFLKMTDELFNNEEFYYPEQFIKPVYSDVLLVKDAKGDEVGKKYVTMLPLVDDGSDNAVALAAKLTGKAADGPYAVSADATGGTAGSTEIPKRTVPENATLALLAQSKEYEISSVTITDPSTGETQTVDAPTHQGDANISGVWDWGFGSVLQYEPMTKDQTINVTKISFTYHYHVTPWTEGTDDDGNSIHIPDFNPATCCRQAVYEINLASDTASDILTKIKDIVDAETKDDGDSGIDATLIACPTEDQLKYMLLNCSNVKTAISPEDQDLAGVYFDDPVLQEAFGNAAAPVGGGAYVRATQYPLKVPVISAAATFSGNIRYKYSMSTLTNDLMDETSSTSSVEGSWGEDCSTINYKTFVCGTTSYTCTIDRAGTLTTTQPSAMSGELSEPLGFQYVEDYGNHYRAYVPNRVRKDMDFKERVYEKQEGADSLSAAEKDSYDADQDGEITVMDFLIKIGLLTPYSGGTLGQTGGITQGEISAEDQADMAALGCSMDEDGQVRLLAKVIGAEAGPNKLDQLLVGAVVVNRVYSPEFAYADSIIEVIKAPSQYASWSNGSIASMEPTEEMLSSARQILNGEFAVPANIVFQAAFTQGDTTWLVNVNGPGYYTHYYCCNGTPQTTDTFGRTALTEAQARDLAEQLHQQDVSNGIAAGGGGSGIGASPVGSSTIITDGIWNGQKLYANENFNLQKALSAMKQVSDRENLGFLGTIYALGSAIADVFEQISKFMSITGSLFRTEEGELVELYATTVAMQDIRDTVIQAVTFSSQNAYSNTAEEFDPNVLQFLFVGEDGWAGAVQGTTGFGGSSFIPGVGSTLTGFSSPTTSHYGVISPWTAASGSVSIAIPSGTAVLAVGDTEVTEVTETDGKYKVVMTGTADGKSISVTYDNLASVNVAIGDALSKGDTVGTAGQGGMIMTLLVDGVNVDPMTYFYQSTFGAGVSFYDVLDADGLIDQTKVDELSALLNSANVRTNGPYDKWHDPSGINTRSVGQCTWWAWGRGYQFCEENNCMPSGHFGYDAGGGNGYGNGVDYYSRAGEDFAVGQVAASNSWISWAWTRPDSSGNWYGHVAFVEAVGADGTILISDCGSSIWNNGPGIRLKTVRNTGTATNPNYYLGDKYRFAGFVYLNQPK